MSSLGSVNDKVRSLLEKQIADGRQIGVQVCAYKDGKIVVDTWAGKMGPDDPRPVQGDSLFCSFSTTKGVTATAIHILADRGLIEYEAPVAQYWPKFAQNGKEKITVAQALSHQAGLHAMPKPYTVETLIDWEGGLKYIEGARPAYEPGTATGYHGYTFGWIAGGIVEGATGRHIKDVIREEIAEPLGVEDEMFVGIPDGVEDRLTTLEIWDLQRIFLDLGIDLPPDSDWFKAMPSELWWYFNLMSVRKACIPSVNGHFTARALAKMYAALAGDGSIDEVRLVSSERIAEMQRLMTDDIDIVLGRRVYKSIGYMLGGEWPMSFLPRTAFGHPGAGGSIGFADPEAGLSIAVTLNKMNWPTLGKFRAKEICDLIRSELGIT